MGETPPLVLTLAASDEVLPGGRTGPGFEGLRCPACGAQFRARLDREPARFRCPCGREFDAAGLSCPAMEADTVAGAPPATLMVHASGAGQPPPTLAEGGKPPSGAAAGTPAPAPPRDAAGGEAGGAKAAEAPVARFGKYEILGEVARGGMGVVYRARQAGLNREVALKMLLAGEGADEEQIRRFLREAESAAKLSHPNIVPIYDIGQEQGQHYYAMEFIHGESVAGLINRLVRLPTRQALRIAREVALALHFAHEHGIVHRDVKPA
ncbi:MAG: serine/threonine protein kinase, partial [Planctomycetes bacterium]|nr:serine/threonine protein kinase [Planctomycetota bacterium]